ncbi:MAG: S8 family serine peptidase, partial [Peptococcales bacterium]|jgi:tripeptidyl-peptidase-2
MEYPYMLTEGTSMATPHVSGVVAHLLEAGDKLGIKTNPAFIKRVIEEGARDLPDFQVIEDGHGVLDAYGSWQKMQSIKEERKLAGTLFSPEYGSGPGVYAREYIPQRLVLKLTNHDKKDYQLEWSSSADWLKSELKSTHILRRMERDIPIAFNLPEKSGLYSGVLKGDDPSIPGIEIEIPVNIIIGEQIHLKRPYAYTRMDSLEPSQFARYFITVPEGTNSLKAELEVFPNTGGSFEGRARLHLIDPFGFEEDMSDYAGLAPYAVASQNKAEARAYFPEPGTWELVVYSSASLSIYNTQQTKYQLTVTLGNMVSIDPIIESDLDLVISPIPQGVLKKTKGTVILHIWDKAQNAPFTGALEINGKFYEIQNGRVEYDVNKIKQSQHLRLTTLL